MVRLPQPGSDSGQWGEILNDFLSQVHKTDGTLKDNVVTSSSLAPSAVNVTNVAAPGGADGQVLSKDSAQPNGLSWVSVSGADAYTKAETDALLAAKANDVSVVKTTGNQSITGTKNFAVLQQGGQAVVTTTDSRLNDDRNPLINSVDTAAMADGAVTEPKLAASNVPSSGQLLSYDGTNLNWVSPAAAGDPTLGGDLSGTASTAKIVAGAVGTTELADNSVTNAKLADASVDTTQLVDAGVTGVKLADGSVTSAKIVDGTIAEGDLAAAVQTKLNAIGSGVGVQKAGTLSGTRPTINLVEGSNVSISATDDPVNNRVDIAISAAGAGGAPDASTTTKGIVKLAGDLAGTADLPVVADGAIVTARLADNAVTTTKILDGSVTGTKLSNGAVGTAKLANASVTSAKLGTAAAPTNGQVLSYDGTTSQMKWVAAGGGSVTLTGDVTGPSSATVLANGSVTAAKLSASGPASGQVLGYNGSALSWMTTGATLLAGSGAPTAGDGNNGDIYIDTDTNMLYGPKVGGVWPAGQDLTGPAGPTGAQGLEGISPPPFAQLGTLVTGTGMVRWYNDTGSNLSISYIRATVGTPATGGPITVDVNLSGNSIFTTFPQPSIAAGAYTKKVLPSAINTTSVPINGYLTVDITAVGTTTAGADLYVAVGLERA